MRVAVWGIVLAMAGTLAVGLGDRAAAEAIRIPPRAAVPDLPVGTPVRSISFGKIAVALTPGQPWGEVQGGIICYHVRDLTWTGGRRDAVNQQVYADIFRNEIENAGFKIEGQSGSLFEESRADAEFVIAGTVKSIKARFCDIMSVDYNLDVAKGAAVMQVEWQIYSRLQQSVVATVVTRGGFEIKTSGEGNVSAVLEGAYTENVRGLIASDDFRQTLIGAERAPGEIVRPSDQSAITLNAPPPGAARAIADAIGSVVLVKTADGHGSGFLISSDGYVLTDRHVVGEIKTVKIRWADGIETLGEVVRSSKARDVALIKTDPRGRPPLALRLTQPQPGDTVFAIGAPLEAAFQSTVTRGIVSANRTLDGLSYIQSDVTVNPGSSGGPLLNDKGEVIGMTDLGMQQGGGPTGVNLFTPARDALDFLGVKAP